MIYTIYNPETGLVINGVFEIPAAGYTYTTVPYMHNFAKPKFNAATQSYENAATAQEQADYEASLAGPNVMVTDDGVYVKDVGDGEMKKITIDNGVVKIE